jgi:hypothetical protein
MRRLQVQKELFSRQPETSRRTRGKKKKGGEKREKEKKTKRIRKAR